MGRWMNEPKREPYPLTEPWPGTHSHSLSGIHTPFLCLSSFLVLNKTLALGASSEASSLMFRKTSVLGSFHLPPKEAGNKFLP